MPVAPAVEAAEVGEFGFNKFVEAPIAGANDEQAPVFESLTPTPPMTEARPIAPAPAVETVLNTVALLLVLSPGCSIHACAIGARVVG
jgi:hypothetical protein